MSRVLDIFEFHLDFLDDDGVDQFQQQRRLAAFYNNKVSSTGFMFRCSLNLSKVNQTAPINNVNMKIYFTFKC